MKHVLILLRAYSDQRWTGGASLARVPVIVEAHEKGAAYGVDEETVPAHAPQAVPVLGQQLTTSSVQLNEKKQKWRRNSFLKG